MQKWVIAFCFIFSMAINGQGAQVPPTSGDASKNFSVMLNYSPASLDTKQKFCELNEKDFVKLYNQSKLEERELLALLYYSKQIVRNNLTDAELGWEFENNRIINIASAIFKKQEVAKRINILENFSPADLKKIFESIVATWYSDGDLPEGAVGTTWSSERMKVAVESVRKVELVRGSVALKLLVAQKDIVLPSSIIAVFDWSNNPSIKIELAQPTWTSEDLPALKRLQASQYESYRISAKKIIDKLENK